MYQSLQCVCVCMELLSFNYAKINWAIQPRRIDISPLYIHQWSTHRCHNSCININTRRDQKLCGQQPLNQANCCGSRERRWSWWIRIYVSTAVQCHYLALCVRFFYEMMSSLQTGWLLCAWDRERIYSNWNKIFIMRFCVFCVHSTVLSLLSSWRRFRCG